MKITLAQLNPVVGDINGNLTKIKDALSKYGDKTDLIVFSELFITGYPPRDLLEKPDFINKTLSAVDRLVKLSLKYPGTGIITGAPLPTRKKTSKPLYNSAIFIYRGKIILQENKSLLPSYDVFDEERYFESADEVNVIDFKGEKIGISICEDMWSVKKNDNSLSFFSGANWSDFNPVEVLAEKGASFILNISASPFCAGKESLRYDMIRKHAKKFHIPFIFLNQVGANDELIFDGRSISVDKNGDVIKIFPSFKENVETIEITSKDTVTYIIEEKSKSVYDALVMGVRDYIRKCGFSKAVIGLSGGIDSAVTASIAADALGRKNILSVLMPSPYTTDESRNYSREVASRLGINFKVIPITDIYSSYKNTMCNFMKLPHSPDITLQNIQARIRGNILMALSNKFGYLVLSTGNKSELAVGYSTLYGDLAGGLAVISDVPKTMVYELAQYINRDSEIIPNEVILRAPSAELKPEQTDQETLPPYEILDGILECYIEKNYSFKEIIKEGYKEETVKWVVDFVNKNEYKRRQSPPGLKVTSKAFGIGRRMPVASKGKDYE